MPVRFNSLKDKRVLLTGGTTGIGRATLMLLAEEGGASSPMAATRSISTMRLRPCAPWPTRPAPRSTA